MIVTLKKDILTEHKQQLFNMLTGVGLKGVCLDDDTKLCILGDTSMIDKVQIKNLDCVEYVEDCKTPYKLASRQFHKDDTIIDVGGVKIGGQNFQIIAGPCSVESEKQLLDIATAVKKAGATILRGGAYKPRTSPYTFQGLGKEGIDILYKVKNIVGMPVITEITSLSHLDQFENVDIIQVGARNMQNYDLLKGLGKIDKPILLKRGVGATLDEWLMSAEYILSGGNSRVILCERGVRTFDANVKNTLDASAICKLHDMTHLPIIVDPSHTAGVNKYVSSLALSAVALGVNGLMIEVHNNPKGALSDGIQALTPVEFSNLSSKIYDILSVINK